MALLTRQAPAMLGAVVAYVAAAAGGDTFTWEPAGVLRVKNASAGPITVTVVVPGNTEFGQAQPDLSVVVAAGVEKAIGPFPRKIAVDGVVSATYSAVATVTVAYT